MNQILSVEMKKKQTKKSNSPKMQIEMKKIVIFFVAILLVFGLILAGKSIISMTSNAKKQEEGPAIDEPSITASKQNGSMILTITNKKEITKVTYNWNGGENKEIPGQGSNYLEATIEMPVGGDNVLNIITTDIEGKETTSRKEFPADPDEPQVTLEEAGKNVKIRAKDNERLRMITYRWDEEPEEQIEIPADSSAQVEKEIPIKLGTHTLTVVVVNSKNKQITKTQEIKAIKEPEATIEVDPQDKSYVILTGKDEVSLMKELIFYVNGKGYRVPETEAIENGTIIQWRFQVEPGLNEIEVKAINKDDLEGTKKADYTYIQE